MFAYYLLFKSNSVFFFTETAVPRFYIYVYIHVTQLMAFAVINVCVWPARLKVCSGAIFRLRVFIEKEIFLYLIWWRFTYCILTYDFCGQIAAPRGSFFSMHAHCKQQINTWLKMQTCTRETREQQELATQWHR